jgi:hypothetical protein
MTNQEARGILANLEADYRDLNPLVLTNDSIQLVNKRIEALGVAISALQAQDVPDTNVGSAIYKQAAIDSLKGLPTWWADKGGFYGGAQPPMTALLDPEDAVSAIANLPSAQPENIRCYECKYGTHSGCGNVYICNVSPELVMEHTGDFYCGYAERKDDE